LLINAGYEINIGGYYWDDNDSLNTMIYNSNWYDLSKEDQYVLGTKYLWDHHKDEYDDRFDRIDYYYIRIIII